MLIWEQIGLIALGIELIIVIVVWGIAYKKWREIKEERNRTQRIYNLAERIRIRQEDSGNESNGEEEAQLDNLLHANGFDNPMFDWP
ncbi:viral protein U [Simian immunodeficiency virus]|uniref:Protein Vpu n=1 Tax=Simian immunodeficiency virus TaxID=11723 RepID=Q9ICT3_SIV|nr:viral protein U [Simian immunodeficiency virus]